MSHETTLSSARGARLAFRLSALASALLLSACSGGASPATEPDGDDDARDGVATSGEALATAPGPTFIAEGSDACADVAGHGGAWTAQRGEWSYCLSLHSFTSRGCGYVWSAHGGAAPDVDALAAALGPRVARMRAPHGRTQPGAANACMHLSHPNPGSTPCGACQVGIATSRRIYISLPDAPDRDETLTLRAEGASQGYVDVHVPAHTAVFSEAISLPAEFARGIPLSTPSD